MQKHPKTSTPSDQDLTCNPMIGGSKGAYRAGVKGKELEADEGTNTVEGDVENDTNREGGIDKFTAKTAGPTTRPKR